MLFNWYGSVRRLGTNHLYQERERSLTNLLPTKLRPGRSVTWILARLWQLFVWLSNIVVHWVYYVKSHWCCLYSLVRSFIVLLFSLFSLLLCVVVTTIFYSVFRNELFNRLNKFWNHRISFALILFNEASSRPVCYDLEPQHFWLQIKLMLFCTISMSYIPSPKMSYAD